MNTIEIRTQKEFDALKDKYNNYTIIKILKGETIYIDRRIGNASVEAWENAGVVAWGNASVVAWENAGVRARGNASVEASGNASVKAWGNASVEASGNAIVRAWGNASVRAMLTSAVFNYSINTKINAYDNASVYLYQGCNDLAYETSVNVCRNIITPTFEQWLERGIVYADGIYLDLVSKKSLGEITIYTTTKNFGKETVYVAQRGDKFSHGDTVENAIKDLRYKISDRDKSEYEGWTKDDTKPIDEIIEAYRVITGACETGTKMFCEKLNLKDEYKLSEIFEITEGAYGHAEFKGFINERKNTNS